MPDNQEELFAKFLQENGLVWDEENKKRYERFGDFYFPDEKIMFELKSLQETEISKVLMRLPKNQVTAIPYKDSFGSINNHLSDSNTKASRLKEDEQYGQPIFVTLLSIVNGYDLKTRELFGILQGAKFLNYPFYAKNGSFFDEEHRKYFIKERKDENELLKSIDYIGILRKYGDMKDWGIELIEKPGYDGKKIDTKTPIGKFIRIWQPELI